MILRLAEINDYETIVDMFYDFTKEVYPERQIGSKFFFYEAVASWIKDKKDIILVEREGEAYGFTLSYKDYNVGLTEPIYFGEIAYIKPEHRKTRAGYLLYKNVSEIAEKNNLTLVANGLVTNGVSKMIKKHFDCKEMFMNFERNKK